MNTSENNNNAYQLDTIQVPLGSDPLNQISSQIEEESKGGEEETFKEPEEPMNEEEAKIHAEIEQRNQELIS
jgi:hypothetical protein